MMIYDTGNLEGMPWEVIAKAYREKHTASCNNLVDYAKDFFDFIEAEGHLFPPGYQEKQLVSRVADSFLRVSFVTQLNQKDGATPEDKKAKIRARYDLLRDTVQRDDFIEGIDREYIDLHVRPFYEQVFKKIEGEDIYKDLEGALDPNEIFEVAAAALFKARFTTLPTTGIVFAGYGETDYFPQLCHYKCYGLVLGKLLRVHQENDCTKISHDNVSEIKDFAQAEMVKTFIYGASIDALNQIDKFFEATLDKFVKRLIEEKYTRRIRQRRCCQDGSNRSVHDRDQ